MEKRKGAEFFRTRKSSSDQYLQLLFGKNVWVHLMHKWNVQTLAGKLVYRQGIYCPPLALVGALVRPARNAFLAPNLRSTFHSRLSSSTGPFPYVQPTVTIPSCQLLWHFPPTTSTWHWAYYLLNSTLTFPKSSGLGSVLRALHTPIV